MIASATAVGLPKDVGGSGSCSAVPPAPVTPSMMPLQRASRFAAPGMVLTQSTFVAPFLAMYSPPALPARYSSLPM